MKNSREFLGNDVLDLGSPCEHGWLPLLHWYQVLPLKLCQDLGHHRDPSQFLDLGSLDLVLFLGELGGVLLHGVRGGDVVVLVEGLGGVLLHGDLGQCCGPS